MANGNIAPIQEKLCGFNHLPAYARYILHHEIDDFAQILLQLYEEADVPLLRFFASMPREQRLGLVTQSTREMLSLIATNEIGRYIQKSIHSWLNDQVPRITREQVHSQDITLINYVKGKVMRKFIQRYSSDQSSWVNLVEEIDRFIVILNSEMFSSYFDLQKQEINSINEALKKREQQLLEAQEIGQVGSFEWDLVGKKSSYTPQMFKIFEMDGPSNLASFLDDVHPAEREKVRKAIEKGFVDGNYESEYRYIRNNKEKVILSRGKVEFKDGKPCRMVGTVIDVTERHEIIRRLQESEKLHKQAQALTHIGNWSWHIQDDKIKWSDEMYRIYGLEPQSEEITFERFISFIDPKDRDKRIKEIEESLQTLQVQEYHFQITAANGVSKILRGRGEIIADHEKPVMMMGTCQDVTREFTLTTQLKEREQYLEELNRSLQYANEELRRTNEELESFNFIASHDLQEPLRKIQVYSNRIVENGFEELPGPLQDYFERINNASGRMQKLIEDFLSFSQTFKVVQSPEEVDLDNILYEIKIDLATRIEEKGAKIVTTPLPRVYAVAFQVKQLLTNLVSNALKYTHPDVTPEIVITGAIVNGAELIAEGADPETAYSKVSVSDNGIGFDPKYSGKIFELFQRLHSKDTYSGTGIGLALCKKVVKNLNGFIIAHGEPGKGSVFTFYVPYTTKLGILIPRLNSVDGTDQGW